MLFDEDTIKNIDDGVLSARERHELQERFFPKGQTPAWKADLKEKWQESKEAARIEQRWNFYLGKAVNSGQGLFRISHAELVRRAKTYAPKQPGVRVTDFTGWLYSLYRRDPTLLELERGKKVEKQVQFRVGQIKTHSNWELLFQDPLEGIPEAKVISSLKIRSSPMVGIPDVVFREKGTGRILIVERKASNAKVPDDGWPNLRAQLWAYSQIDEWRGAPEILLVGEVWGQFMGSVYISKIMCWNARDTNFNDQNRELFEIYSSWCVQSGSAA